MPQTTKNLSSISPDKQRTTISISEYLNPASSNPLLKKQPSAQSELSLQQVEELSRIKHEAKRAYRRKDFVQALARFEDATTIVPGDLTEAEIASRFDARGVKNRYYTPRFHHACFTLPEYLLEAIANARILTDAEPFVWTA